MEGISQLLVELKGIGFHRGAQQAASGYLVVEGALHTRFGGIECKAWIDRSFQQFPLIQLTPVPESLLPIAPHVGPSGFLCYIASATAVVDIFDPIGQTRAALEHAARVLDQIMAGERVDDLADEFYAFWQGVTCYVDVETRHSGEVTFLEGNDTYVISDDPKRSIAKLCHLPGTVKELRIPVDRVTTRASPRPLIHAWPPKNVTDVLNWQARLDDACRRKIEARIIKAYRKGFSLAFIEIDSPTMPYAFVVLGLQKIKRESALDQRLPIYGARIIPLELVRIDDSFVAQRNIPGQTTLAGKKIALVGCGTIGGYLGEMLAKAGAGTKGGELRLIDKDALEPGNLGRHRLGGNKIFLPKARALAEEIQLVMPSTNVRSFDFDVREVNLSGVDLIIDATGEEALGHWLAFEHSQKTPILHVWIEGTGIAVRAYMGRHASEGCYRCLSDYARDHQFLSVEGETRPLYAGQGCEGPYVPYSASVSVQAAALGLDAAMAWAGKNDWPGLTSRVLSRSHESATADCTVLRKPGCPACRS
ncbi:hypothetical protein PS619_02017 [Pseudomonas fluorescens]|nr:hypothetical protein PS619_02017 [Pseudomonas fluorescens]